ncbi:MAG: glycosyltransferase family 2 protein [Elusimicrobia bacterium]|nr:glycosyltransferase family 2 protein [Elusimicrobiota bacterium]
MKLSIIISAYNEAATIGTILKRVQDAPVGNWEKEIIVVDDGSTDQTQEIVEDYLRTTKTTIRFLKHPVNQGKGAAVRTGVASSTGDAILIQDADLEYDPKDYPALLDPIERDVADVVLGSRFLGQSHRVLFFWHMVGNKIVTLISNIATDLNLTDMMAGYKVFKSSAIKKIPLQSKGFDFEPEITVKMAKQGWRIYEVPVSYQGRTYAEGKKIRWWVIFSVIYALIKYTLATPSVNRK